MNFQRFRVRPRCKPGVMNGIETKYSFVLEDLKRSGQIKDWMFDPFNLRLADKCFYRPDFAVITEDELQIHEVKGFWEDDALAKTKVAAEKFWFFKFVGVTHKKGQWEYREF